MSFKLSNAKSAKTWKAGEVFWFTSTKTETPVRLKVVGMGVKVTGKKVLIGREAGASPECRWLIPATTKNLKNISKTTREMKHREVIEEVKEVMEKVL